MAIIYLHHKKRNWTCQTRVKNGKNTGIKVGVIIISLAQPFFQISTSSHSLFLLHMVRWRTGNWEKDNSLALCSSHNDALSFSNFKEGLYCTAGYNMPSHLIARPCTLVSGIRGWSVLTGRAWKLDSSDTSMAKLQHLLQLWTYRDFLFKYM